MGKIKAGVQGFRNGFTLGKLFAIIRSNRVNFIPHPPQQADDCLSDRPGRTPLHMGYQRIFGLTLGQGHQCLLMPLFYHGVPDARLTVHDGRPLFNGHRVDQVAAALIAAVTLFVLLLTAQITVQMTAGSLILVYVLINPFMAQGASVLVAQPVRDLLRAPLVPQPGFYATPQGVGNTWLITDLPARLCQYLGLPGSVALSSRLRFSSR